MWVPGVVVAAEGAHDLAPRGVLGGVRERDVVRWCDARLGTSGGYHAPSCSAARVKGWRGWIPGPSDLYLVGWLTAWLAGAAPWDVSSVAWAAAGYCAMRLAIGLAGSLRRRDGASGPPAPEAVCPRGLELCDLIEPGAAVWCTDECTPPPACVCGHPYAAHEMYRRYGAGQFGWQPISPYAARLPPDQRCAAAVPIGRCPCGAYRRPEAARPRG